MEYSGQVRRWTTRLFLVICLCLLHSAAYAAVILVTDNRLVRSQGNVSSLTTTQSWTVEERSPGNFGTFNFTVDEARTAGTNTASANASMTSDITESLFTANASAGSSSTLNEAANFSRSSSSGRASFEVTFQILTPMTFDLTGNLSFFKGTGSSRGGAVLSLFNGCCSSTFNISLGNGSAFNDFSQNIQLSGLLDPDTYTLRAQAFVNSDNFSPGFPESGTAAFNFNFAVGSSGAGVAPVPVPAAVWLFGSAIGWLGGMRRRVYQS